MGIGESIRCVSIGVTEDMRHAVGIAQDLDIVVFSNEVELREVFGRHRIENVRGRENQEDNEPCQYLFPISFEPGHGYGLRCEELRRSLYTGEAVRAIVVFLWRWFYNAAYRWFYSTMLYDTPHRSLLQHYAV